MIFMTEQRALKDKYSNVCIYKNRVFLQLSHIFIVIIIVRKIQNMNFYQKYI